MLKPIKSLVLIVILLNLSSALGQEDLNIFGYFQSTFQYVPWTMEFSNQQLGISNKFEYESKSSLLQQMNVFFRKDLDSDLNIWINFQLTNSFSHERKWGAFNIEEAWVRYRHSNLFNLKAGLLIPRFNNLNEVKNRMPYLPYVFRPLVYEASFSDAVGQLEDYVPQRAFLQSYGEFDLGRDTALDYAVYAGDGEADFFSNDDSEFVVQSGVDTTMTLLLGGRLGLKINALKFGASLTLDKDNKAAFGLGSVRRTRIGGDLSFVFLRFTFEGEVIAVKHEQIDNFDLDKLFYYGTLQYDFTDQLFGYLFYSRVEDDFSPVVENGIVAYSPGMGYRLKDTVVIKAQYIRTKLNDGMLPPSEVIPIPLDFKFDNSYFLVAASIFF